MPNQPTDLLDTDLLCQVRSHEISFRRWHEGESNRLATWAATCVVEHPGRRFNPLLLIGKSGVGKTHLALAIGNELLRRENGYSVCAHTAEEFYYEILHVHRNYDFERFINEHCAHVCLIIDDIQSLARKAYSQQQLRLVLERMLRAGRQIVLTSSARPGGIGIGPTLAARMQQGLSVEIMPPTRALQLEHFSVLCSRHSIEPTPSDLMRIEAELGTNHFDVLSAFNRFHAEVECARDLGIVRETPAIVQDALTPARSRPHQAPQSACR